MIYIDEMLCCGIARLNVESEEDSFGLSDRRNTESDGEYKIKGFLTDLAKYTFKNDSL